MEFTAKRKAKRLSKLFFTFGYGFMIALVVYMIGGLILLALYPEELPISGTLLTIIGIALVALCMGGGILGQQQLNKRLFYKQGIAEYRQCFFFTTSLKKLLAGDKKSRNAAIEYYDLIAEDTPRRRFMFAFILAASYYGKNKENAKKGKERLDSILETYDPEKVVMTK